MNSQGTDAKHRPSSANNQYNTRNQPRKHGTPRQIGMQFNGKLLTLLMLAVAVAAASFAWWFQFDRGRRAIAYWEGTNAAVIRHGEQATLLELRPTAEPADSGALETLEIDGAPYEVNRRVSLDKAPGFVHARHAMIDDASYLWEQPPPETIQWSHALLFKNKAGESITVLVALGPGLVRPLKGTRALQMDEILQRGLKQFFEEHLATPQ